MAKIQKIQERFGVEFFDCGRTQCIESGCRPIGHTAYDPKRGSQVFWFKDKAEWEEHRRNIFEVNWLGQKPVPFFEASIVEEDAPEDIKIVEKPAPPEFLANTPGASPVPVTPDLNGPAIIPTEEAPKLEIVEPAASQEEVQTAETQPVPAPVPAPVRETPVTIDDIVSAINSTPVKKRFADVATILNTSPESIRQVIQDTPNCHVAILVGGWLAIN